MKRLLAVLFALVPFYAALAQTPTYSLLWERIFNLGGTLDIPNAISVDTHKELFVNGNVSSAGTGIRPAIAKFNAAGSLLWKNADTTSPTYSFRKQLVVLANGKLIRAYVENTHNTSYLTGCDTEGNVTWSMMMPGPTYLAAYGDTLIAVSSGPNATCSLMDSSGTVTRQFQFGFRLDAQISPDVYGDTLFVSGLTPNGATVASFSLASGMKFWQQDVMNAFTNTSAVDDSGNVYAGMTLVALDSLHGPTANYFVKYGPDGTKQYDYKWFSRNVPYDMNYGNAVTGIAVSSSKNLVVVSGVIQKGLPNSGQLTAILKGFAASTGEPVWEKIWDYPEDNGISIARHVAFDRNSDLVVLGNTYRSSIGNPPNVCHLEKYQVDKVTKVEEVQMNSIPESFSLSQNYPNPFNPSTTIRYAVPRASEVTLIVYDALGREVETLSRGMKSAGTYEVLFTTSNLPSGTYFYRLTVGTKMETKKMVLVK